MKTILMAVLVSATMLVGACDVDSKRGALVTFENGVSYSIASVTMYASREVETSEIMVVTENDGWFNMGCYAENDFDNVFRVKGRTNEPIEWNVTIPMVNEEQSNIFVCRAQVWTGEENMFLAPENVTNVIVQ